MYLKRECREYKLVMEHRRQRTQSAYKRGRTLPEVIKQPAVVVEFKFMSDLFRCSAVYTDSLPASKRCLPVKHLVELRTRLCGVSTVLETLGRAQDALVRCFYST